MEERARGLGFKLTANIWPLREAHHVIVKNIREKTK
jgi:hypothetical protein